MPIRMAITVIVVMTISAVVLFFLADLLIKKIKNQFLPKEIVLEKLYRKAERPVVQRDDRYSMTSLPYHFSALHRGWTP